MRAAPTATGEAGGSAVTVAHGTSGAGAKDRERLSLGQLVHMALGFGLAFGGLEAIEAAALRHIPSVRSLTRTSLDVLWVTPVFHVVVALILAIGLFLVIRIGVPIRRSAATAVFSIVGATAVTSYSGWIGRSAAVLLAIGVGIQAARSSGRPGFSRWVDRFAAVVAAGALVAFIGLRARESRMFSEVLGASAPVHDGPNVLVLVLDTVRGDYLSVNGFSRPLTPALDRLAAEGVNFTQAYSASSWTLPSHASLLTGLPITGHGATSLWHNLGGDKLQLQQVLRDQGYATGAFAANKAFVLPEWGFGKGFDRFDVFNLRTLFARTSFGGWLRAVLRRYDITMSPFRPAAVINAHLEHWIESIGARPFFALVNYMEAHEPYGQPGSRPSLKIWNKGANRTPAENAVLAQAYERGIHDLDVELGAMFDRLSRQPWWSNTLVIVVADHGEAISDNSFDHGLDLTWEQIEVPLIIRFPAAVPSGLRVNAPVSTNDVAATIQELVHSTAQARVPGVSLSRFWNNGVPDSKSSEAGGVLSELVHPSTQELYRAIMLDDLQYILNVDTGTERLFRFHDDPGGARNLAADPALAADLQRMRDALARQPAPVFRR